MLFFKNKANNIITPVPASFIASGKTLRKGQELLKKGVHFHFIETIYAFFFQVGFLSIGTLDLDWKHS